MILLEIGTNVTISSYCHIIFLGSAWNKTEFQNLARSWVLGFSFSIPAWKDPQVDRPLVLVPLVPRRSEDPLLLVPLVPLRSGDTILLDTLVPRLQRVYMWTV